MYVDIVIHQPKDLEAPEGSKVLVRMTRWEKTSRTPEGEILEIIGIAGEHNTEMESIVRERGFDTAFPETVEAEAKAIRAKESPTPASEIATRRDFRKTLTFTIDPIDAKDFDDAISFKKLADGKFEIGVHIADVSHYVRPGTALDREAVKRGFSVYLVDRTIPMLPEILSNDLCSLNAHEDKLAFSSVFVMDSNGAISDRWFGKSIINSAKRFTYEAAQETLDAKSGEYFEELNTLNKIAYKLREEKWKNGAIDFEQDEVKFELDKAGRPIRVYRKTRKDAHKLVEEYMLLANREVAEVLYKAHNKEGQKPTGVALYRIHDVPDREKIADFQPLCGAWLTCHQKDGEIKAKDLQALMNAVAGKAEESMIRTAAVRSMARRSTRPPISDISVLLLNITHTSPRRFADMRTWSFTEFSSTT